MLEWDILPDCAHFKVRANTEDTYFTEEEGRPQLEFVML